MSNPLIIIPARYGSTRLPGKPLMKICGETLLSRVYSIGKNVAKTLVATDDERIAAHCKEIGAPYIMTPTSCLTGSDRVYAALQKIEDQPDFVINLQGDAPLTPPSFLTALIESKRKNPSYEVITVAVQLSFDELAQLREEKKTTPFSGTTAIIHEEKALWFSKAIIPAIRQEDALKKKGGLSPIFQHVGLYGYTPEALNRFVNLPESQYERLEGLEQLRFIENGISIYAIPVSGAKNFAGVDSIEDIARVEKELSH